MPVAPRPAAVGRTNPAEALARTSPALLYRRRVRLHVGFRRGGGKKTGDGFAFVFPSVASARVIDRIPNVTNCCGRGGGRGTRTATWCAKAAQLVLL
jgi:hypothetical protein